MMVSVVSVHIPIVLGRATGARLEHSRLTREHHREMIVRCAHQGPTQTKQQITVHVRALTILHELIDTGSALVVLKIQV